jgi:hypothetical protein
VNNFRCKGIRDHIADDALRNTKKEVAASDSRLTGFNQKEVRFPPTIKRKPKLFFRIKALLLSRHENQTHSASAAKSCEHPAQCRQGVDGVTFMVESVADVTSSLLSNRPKQLGAKKLGRERRIVQRRSQHDLQDDERSEGERTGESGALTPEAIRNFAFGVGV